MNRGQSGKARYLNFGGFSSLKKFGEKVFKALFLIRAYK